MRKTSIFHFVFISGREALIWFIIMKLNSRYLFPSVKHLRRHSLIQTEETNMYKGAKRAFSRRLSSLVKSSQQDPPHIRATHGPDLFQSRLIPSAGQKKGRQHFLFLSLSNAFQNSSWQAIQEHLLCSKYWSGSQMILANLLGKTISRHGNGRHLKSNLFFFFFFPRHQENHQAS